MHLAELLVATTLLALVLGGALGLLEQGRRAYGWGAARVESQQAARAALVRMAAEIRQAGLDPRGAGFAAITVAERARVVVQLDLDGDGRIAGRERVTWQLRGTVLRRTAGRGGAQPVANGIADLAFEYRDAGGAPTAVPGDVRIVGIALTARPAAAPPGASAAHVTVATQVRLRNR